MGLVELPITAVHAAGVTKLPPIHRDPFDHLSIAQSAGQYFVDFVPGKIPHGHEVGNSGDSPESTYRMLRLVLYSNQIGLRVTPNPVSLRR